METQAIQFTKEALWLVLLLSAPPIAAATLVALIVAMAQAVTQIQEQTVQHLVKLIAVALALFITAPLLGGSLYQFADRLLLGIPDLAR
jgi:type III secretion protein S